MRAFILHCNSGLWMAFGEDAVSAANTLPENVRLKSWTQIGVGGSHSLDKPIDLRTLWPYFTNNPTHTESPK